MRELTIEELESIFPAECHFKVIAMNLIGIHKRLNEVLMELGINDCAFQPGIQSRNGKYMSYDISIQVESHLREREIDHALRAVQGVKMVM